MTNEKKPVNNAEKMWSEIQNVTLDIFALPGQLVKDHCSPVPLDPNKCYLEVKSPAVLPALESAVGTKYSVEKVDRFIVLSNKVATQNTTSLTTGVSVVTVESKV